MHIQYGSYKLKFSKVDNFQQEMVYSEDRFEYLHTKYSLSATCLLNLDKDRVFFSPTPNTMAELIVAVRALFASRQNLVLRMGAFDDTDLNDPLSPQQGWNETESERWPMVIEANYPDEIGGPFVTLVGYTQFVGNQTVSANIRVEFAVHERDCSGVSQPNTFLRSHRWSQSLELDDAFMQTRTTEGVLVVNTNAGLQCADELRRFAFPALPVKGWKRELISLRQSHDGRTLRYTIKDKEYLVGPPRPLTTFRGNYKEATDDGVNWYKTISLTGKAPREVPKSTIVGKLTTAALSRINLLGGAGVKDIIMQAEFEEIIEENSVTLYLRALRGTGVLNEDGIPMVDSLSIGRAMEGTELGQTYDFSDSSTARTEFSDDFLRLMFSPWNVDYCTVLQSDATSPARVPESQRFEWTGIGATTSNPVPNPGSLPSNTMAEVSPDNIEYPYILDNFRTYYKTTENRLQLPVARSSDEDDANFTRTVAVRTAASQTIRVTEFEYKRIGKWPILPEPLNFEGESILAYEYDPRPPALLPDGQTYLYHVTGRMEFAVLNGVDRKTSLLTPGKLPSNQKQVQAAQVPADAYNSYLTHYSGNLPGSTGNNPGGPDIPIA